MVLTLTRPPGKRLTLPGEHAVRGLPGAKRRDAAVGRALDGVLPRRQDARRRRTLGRSCRRGHVGCVTVGGPGRWRVRGNGAAAAARAVRLQRKGSGPGCRPHSGETPRNPGHLRRGTPRIVQRNPPGCCPGLLHEPGRGRSAWRAEGAPLKTLEIFVTGSGRQDVWSDN